jgi:6-pyruvoyltetrahydropterin/6-carboxytetrahydropterin synthase
VRCHAWVYMGGGYTPAMYELEIRKRFSAAHAILMRGVREPVHGHDWEVTVTVGGDRLDDDGLLCDFHAVERQLDAIVRPMDSRHLNETPPFDQINPTAEHVAKFIAEALVPHMPDGVRVASVRVTEAPGCAARFMPAGATR